MKFREDVKAWYKQYKVGKCCKFCGEHDNRCLDFHHVEGEKKNSSISRMVSNGKSKLSIRREMMKCIILCSNCHRKYHAEDRKKRNKSLIQKILLQIKLKSKCKICNEKTPCCLDFHHVDPSNKRFSIGNIVKMRISVEDLLAEIEKCIVLCSNCHRKLHLVP